ncbi:MAG TPA: pyridoxine 5'-phosphate synthase, partial [Pyrinomonadaceae bacterium]|nr:pyridoxine 5'-phosphate synthase [Pyrinomonadaceae bacterium]
MTAKLNVNIDHVATVRQARRAPEPSVIAAALACEQAGAHGITVHLRGDRRHIQDEDVFLLKRTLSTYLNVEMAATEEMTRIALETKPDAVTLVPETPEEITTTGGLNVAANLSIVRSAISQLRETGILTSIFIDPDPEQIEAAHAAGTQQIELCTAEYAELTLGSRAVHVEGSMRVAQELRRLREAAEHAGQFGLKIAAGHGLTYRNVRAVAEITDITEFNIGH